MIDQRFMNQLADDMREPEEPVQEVLLAAGPVTSDVNMPFVGTRLNVPRAGQPQPTEQDREKLAIGLLDSLAGALRGAAAQTLGLPGDIRSIIDMIAQEGAEKYLGQRSFATTEEILQDTSVRVPGTNINVPFPPVLGADVPRRAERQPTVETAQEVGTFLPAPGIPEAVIRSAKLAGKAAQIFGPKMSKMTEDYMVKQGLISQVVPDDVSYRGAHEAPTRDFGAPLSDLTGNGTIYPSDVYSANGVRYYGDGSALDNASFAIANQFKGKPNATVTIYRAIPSQPTKEEKLAKLEKDMAAYLRRGKLPNDAFTTDGNKWYDWASEEKRIISESPEEAKTITPKINPGDWVTINRQYAKLHGDSVLLGNYKIISKKVKASEIFTNGDSINEWGYDPIKKSVENK